MELMFKKYSSILPYREDDLSGYDLGGKIKIQRENIGSGI
jgi:hypothetical protein